MLFKDMPMNGLKQVKSLNRVRAAADGQGIPARSTSVSRPSTNAVCSETNGASWPGDEGSTASAAAWNARSTASSWDASSTWWCSFVWTASWHAASTQLSEPATKSAATVIWHKQVMIGGFPSVLQAEAWGLFYEMKLALDLSITHLEIESDSAVLVNLLKQDDIDYHPLGIILINCKHFLQYFNYSQVQHVHRERNMAC
ncbi:hypothetical protein RchiOBHm_Chr0c16g0499901 [Rosa chinensis]|uniref:RNase H type-1 domain-containing protein n=1 Tax=Rosa chinensis TaxID=74649 RepID=A0A2P6SQP8_ROSCH|nr:hypothetical protein RchiOBHm_Chr0c16g0499901 [Rosa chinensis]